MEEFFKLFPPSLQMAGDSMKNKRAKFESYSSFDKAGLYYYFQFLVT